ncbi:MMPL family transporter [Verrucomicrobiota bacterium sgz303538]
MSQHSNSQLFARLADRLAYLVVQRPKTVIAATLLFLGACVWILASQSRLDSEVLNLLPQNSEAIQALKVVNSEFRQGRELVFALHGTPDEIADFEDHFVEQLRAEPWVERVFAGSPMESPEEIAALQAIIPQLLLNLDDEAFTPALASLSPQALEERVRRLKTEIESGSPRVEMEANVDPLGVVGKAMRPMTNIYGMEKGQTLASQDGTLKLFPVVTNQPSLSQPDCKAIMTQVEAFRQRIRSEWKGSGAAPEVLVTGRTAYVAQIAESMESDVQVTSTISIFIVTCLFFVGFRRFLPPLCTTLILGLACFASFAIGCLLFENLNMIAIAFCSILVGMGDDFSLLLYNRYLLARSHGEDHQTGVATSIREMGRGIVYVSLTTGAGFLVMLFSGSSGFAQLGTLIAIGIVLCAISIIVLLFLFIRPTHARPDRPDPLHGLFDGLSRMLLRFPVYLSIPMSVLAVATVTFAVLPVRQLQFDTNPRSLEPKNIPGAITLRTINEKIPAASEPIVLVLDAPDAQASHDYWKTLDSHLQQLVTKGVLSNYSSPAALMLSPERMQRHRAQLQQSLNVDESRTAFKKALEKEGFNAESFAPAFTFFDQLKAAAQSTSNVLNLDGTLPTASSWWFLLDRYLGTRPLLASAYVRPAHPLQTPEDQAAFEKELRPPGVPVKITGWSYAMVGMVPWAKRELVLFSGAVGLLILISLAVAYRHWKPLLVHTLSLAFALGGCLCLLKLTDTRINMLNALAFPLVLGVGVDYGMHLILALGEGENPFESLSTVLKPLIISGLTTIAGFGSLMFAQNPALKGLGTVCALGVTSCLATSVFFAVPVMALIHRRDLGGHGGGDGTPSEKEPVPALQA